MREVELVLFWDQLWVPLRLKKTGKAKLWRIFALNSQKSMASSVRLPTSKSNRQEGYKLNSIKKI